MFFYHKYGVNHVFNLKYEVDHGFLPSNMELTMVNSIFEVKNNS